MSSHLDRIKTILDERQATYGSPGDMFKSWDSLQELFAEHTSTQPVQRGLELMLLYKVARYFTANKPQNDLDDIVGYAVKILEERFPI